MSESEHDAVASNSIGTSTADVSKTAITTQCLPCAPVTALEFLPSSNLLVAAEGPYLKLFDIHRPIEAIHELKLWSFQRIHGIVQYPCDANNTKERLLVFGGKLAAIVVCDRERYILEVERIWTANDWLLAGAFLKDASILLVTSHNTLLIYDFDDASHGVALVQELHCQERPLLWSACFAKDHYEDEEIIYIAVGTIMNEILVWRPFKESGIVERRLVGHNGSVFFVNFAPIGLDEGEYCLASGSDDRDVRLWRWNNGSDHCTSSILRGHFHRPWKGRFTEDGKTLVTVGEDLRCLIWDATVVSEDMIASPVGQYKGHEGKNIWSVAVSASSALIATGGSDGAIRLWPLKAEQHASPIFTTTNKDVIVTFDVSDTHITFLTKHGDVYGARVGCDSDKPRLLFTVDSPKRNVQAELAIHGDSLWLWTRNGQVYRKNFSKGHSFEARNIDSMPVAVAASPHGQHWAVYDRRTRTVQIWTLGEEGLLKKMAQSDPTEAEKLPKYIAWLDDRTILLADAISTIWIHDFSGTAGKLTLLHSGRLATKGTFAVQADMKATGVFWVGNKEGCTSYRFARLDGQVSLKAVGLQCLHQGVVKQLHSLSKLDKTLFLACDNTSGRVIDETGQILARIACPGSSAQTLRLASQGDTLHFYCNTGTELCHTSRDLSIPAVLQEGLQGREIWSVDLCRLPSSKRVLCAISAEDNTIKISQFLDSSESSTQRHLETLFSYPDPDGTLQNVCWSASDFGDSAILFVTAAKERLYALRVTMPEQSHSVYVLKAGGAPRDKSCSIDSRTMALSVLKLPNSIAHKILAGSSDGSLKLWHYNEYEQEFCLQWSSTWHDRCILSLKLLTVNGATWAISGDTMGRIAVWTFTSGTPLCVLEDVHQSGVNCLDACFEKDHLHIVSGGDDCALAYSVLSVMESSVTANLPAKKENAHSSSLKGVQMIKPYAFTSTSTDQRLTAWTVLEDQDGRASFERTSSVATSVADVADLVMLPATGKEQALLVAVAGMGLEILKVGT